MTVNLHRGEDVLPEKMFSAFLEFVHTGLESKTNAVICAVIAEFGDPDSIVIKIQFSPEASTNPHMASMCGDIAGMFQRMATKFDLIPGKTQ